MTEMLVRRREIYHAAIKPISPTAFWFLLESLIYFPDLPLQSVVFKEVDVYLQFLSKARGKLHWDPILHLWAGLGRQGKMSTLQTVREEGVKLEEAITHHLQVTQLQWFPKQRLFPAHQKSQKK